MNTRLFPRQNRRAFTLIELLTVMAIILVLIGLASVSYTPIVNSMKGSAAAAQIQALSLGIDNYADDNGEVPQFANMPTPIDDVDPRGYKNTMEDLFSLLTGRKSVNERPQEGTKDYMPNLKNNMIGDPTGNAHFIDPWKNPFGYNANGEFNRGAYDLWSTGGGSDSQAKTKANWVTNWTVK